MANTMGFVNLAEGARLLPEGSVPVVIYSSTDKVYGEAKTLPYTEEHDLGGWRLRRRQTVRRYSGGHLS
jgi:nucleoside-diphosphate-sugar epimerase